MPTAPSSSEDQHAVSILLPATDAMPAPLVATDVHYRYPRASQLALIGVNLRVGPGECVALLGPNGAGKSTLIKAATGLIVPDRGQVRIAGGDPTRAAARRSLGVMLQATALPTHLSVSELVVGAARRVGQPRGAATAVLEEVGLTDLAGRRAKALSGGQQRRVQLARALVCDPALLILDEPTAGLDGNARKDFWTNLAARRDAGMAVLLTTHLIEEAGGVADRVTVIAEGRVVADTSPAELTDRLPDRTVTMRTTIPVERLRGMKGVANVRRDETAPGDDRQLIRVSTSQPEHLLRVVLADDPGLVGLRVEGATLEEAVLAVSAHPATLDHAATSEPNER